MPSYFVCLSIELGYWLWCFNTTFNNISVISWQSVLLVKETADLSQVTDKLYVLWHGRVLHIETTLNCDKMIKYLIYIIQLCLSRTIKPSLILIRILVHLTQIYMCTIGITLHQLSVWGGKVIVMWNIN